MKKFCKKCGKLLSKHCTGDLCNSHRDRSGKNNSFYGKKHDPKTIENTKRILKTISEQKWQDPNYRERVIKGVSKPRNPRFKTEQSHRMTQWYRDNPNQKVIRTYIDDSSITSRVIPCGAIEEFYEIIYIFPDRDLKILSLNLRGHGSLVMGNLIECFRSIPYKARIVPEYQPQKKLRGMPDSIVMIDDSWEE